MLIECLGVHVVLKRVLFGCIKSWDGVMCVFRRCLVVLGFFHKQWGSAGCLVIPWVSFFSCTLVYAQRVFSVPSSMGFSYFQAGKKHKLAKKHAMGRNANRVGLWRSLLSKEQKGARVSFWDFGSWGKGKITCEHEKARLLSGVTWAGILPTPSSNVLLSSFLFFKILRLLPAYGLQCAIRYKYLFWLPSIYIVGLCFSLSKKLSRSFPRGFQGIAKKWCNLELYIFQTSLRFLALFETPISFLL